MKYHIDNNVYYVYNVYMSKIQYTIRNIPPSVDLVIKKRANRLGKSFNQTVVDILTLQTFGTIKPPKDNNFDWLFNVNSLDKSFDEAINEQSLVDKSLWQ